MKFISNQLGKLDYDKDQIILFNEGLLGFEHLTKFLLVHLEETLPFEWLVSLEESMIAFPIINPVNIVPDYTVQLNKENMYEGFLKSPESNVVYNIVNFSNGDPTVNLRGPIIINEKEKCGKQMVLNDDRYSFQHHISEPSINMETA